MNDIRTIALITGVLTLLTASGNFTSGTPTAASIRRR